MMYDAQAWQLSSHFANGTWYPISSFARPAMKVCLAPVAATSALR